MSRRFADATANGRSVSMGSAVLPAALEGLVVRQTPTLWLNEHWRPFDGDAVPVAQSPRQMYDAEARLSGFSTALMVLFPDLIRARGLIESPLLDADRLQLRMSQSGNVLGRWLIKADHALPVAGSIKARGGVYAVLLHAESLARRNGLMSTSAGSVALALPPARALFSRHHVAVSSTGNLGLSVGLIAAALGFQTTVHMSADAKSWKKARLRSIGVRVVEHSGDFTAAVEAGRRETAHIPNGYFIDDEASPHLFWGYLALRRCAYRSRLRGAASRWMHSTLYSFIYLAVWVAHPVGSPSD